MAAQIGVDVANAKNELTSANRGPLGDASRAIAIRANGVQWNPDDTRLVACEFSLDRAALPGTLTGVAFAVTPAVELRDTIADVPEAVELTEAQQGELDSRLEDYRRNPNAGSPWEIVKQRLEKAARDQA